MPRKRAEEVELNHSEEDSQPKIYDFDNVISTGSTLLDLAISSNRIRGGGIPGGIAIEVFGPSGTGKTGVLIDSCISVQNKGGEAKYLDPEARLDIAYARAYGLQLGNLQWSYFQPNTVSEIFNDHIRNWEPKNSKAINIIAVDSLAALSTNLELEKGDKMGQRRAKEFSEGYRTATRHICNTNFILMASNQLREGDRGEFTPGGKAAGFYSSLRIRIDFPRQSKDPLAKARTVKTKKINGVERERVVGIHSICTIVKSSIDVPYRTAPIFITFRFGLDDVKANLFWLRKITSSPTYFGSDKKTIEPAIDHIENHNMETELREQVIDYWEEEEKHFRIERKMKQRF